jgi:protein arginine N-methyltransferase 1
MAARARGPSDYYFDSYSHLRIHEDMLQDDVRTLAYRDALTRNPSLVSGKVVLDVGCGTAILSMFAARAGARKVYAVENSDIVHYAREIVAVNGLSETITIFEGVMEEVDIPEPVDVILSEWMGYALLYESMLASVVIARDRFMRPDGTMFPSSARLIIAGLSDISLRKEKIDFWGRVWGFDFKPIRRWALSEPIVRTVDESAVVTEECAFAEFDLNTMRADELVVSARFDLWAYQDGPINGFVVWFDVLFGGGDEEVELTTSPFEKPTHWCQSVFFIEHPIELIADECFTGVFEVGPNAKNARDQDFSIQYDYEGKTFVHQYKMR